MQKAMRFMMTIVLAAGLARESSASLKINAAVLDLEARGQASALVAASVSDFIRSGLLESGRFSIVDRSNMETILKEQGFQKSGCTTSDCAVEIGKLLNVEKMVVGTINKVGTRYTISIWLVDVESGKADQPDSVECDADDLLRDAGLALAHHFSELVELQGKVLSVEEGGKQGTYVYVGLGSQDRLEAILDNLKKEKGNTWLEVKREEEPIRDTKTGKILFRRYKKVGQVEILRDEIQSEASKAKVAQLEGGQNLMEGDLVIIPGAKRGTKLKPFLSGQSAMPPAVSGGGRKTPQPQFEEVSSSGGERGRLFAGSVGKSNNFYGKETLSGQPLVQPILIGRVGRHAIFGMEFGWTEVPGLDFGFPITVEVPGLTNLQDQKWVPDIYSLVVGSIGFSGRLFPFAFGGDRGVFRPYVAGGAQIFLGLYDPDTSSSTTRSTFAFGWGTTAAVGVELGPIFFEVFVRPMASVTAKYKDPSNPLNMIVEEFKMDAAGFQGGFRW